jgi:hypothetical protein
MKFRKKPIVIDAVQFTGGLPYPDGVVGRWRDPMGRAHDDCHLDPRMILDVDFVAVIETLEGPMRVSVGDWVITGVKGERYPCKPDIFAATYDRETP